MNNGDFTPIKECYECCKFLSHEKFGVLTKSPDGRRGKCKQCRNLEKIDKAKHNISSRKYYSSKLKGKPLSPLTPEQQEHKREIGRRSYHLHKETRLAKISEWNKRNREICRNRLNAWRNKNRALSNALWAKRHAMKLKATPKWLTKQHFNEIAEIYKKAVNQSTFNKKYHVDHIVPLNSNLVCGLHVPWNLQVLEATENIKKSNKLL